MSKRYFVYILASKRNGTLYVGVTNNLIRRIWEHREAVIDGFTKKYGARILVHYEVFEIFTPLSIEKPASKSGSGNAR